MADPLEYLFGSKVQTPGAVTVNPTQAAGTAQQINSNAANSYGSYATGLTDQIHNIFNQNNPQVQGAWDTNYNVGTQLANTGMTSAMTNALNYYRQVGLQTAAATGAPVSSSFSQNLGGGIAIQQILQNQLQGSQMLSGVAGQEANVGMAQLQPSFGVLQSNLTTPGQVMNTQLQNAQMQNQQNNLAAQYNAMPDPAGSWMVNELATIANNIGGSAAGLGMMGAL